MDLRQDIINTIDEKFDSLGWNVEKVENEETQEVTWNIFDVKSINLKPRTDKVILQFGKGKVILNKAYQEKLNLFLERVVVTVRRDLFDRASDLSSFIKKDILKGNKIKATEIGVITEDDPQFLYQTTEWEFDDNRKIVLNLISIEITDKDGDTIRIEDMNNDEYIEKELEERIVPRKNKIAPEIRKKKSPPKPLKNNIVGGIRLRNETTNAIDEKLGSSGLVFQKNDSDLDKGTVHWIIKDVSTLMLKTVGYKIILTFRSEKLTLVKFDPTKIDKFMNSIIDISKRKLFGHAFNIQTIITDFLDDNGIEYDRYGGISQTGEEEDFLDQTEWDFEDIEIRLNLYSLEINGDFLEDIENADNVITFIKEKIGYKESLIVKINPKLMKNLAELMFGYKPMFRFVSLSKKAPFVLEFEDDRGKINEVTVNDEVDLVRFIKNL